ncbi:MAG: carbohydrate porin [Phycisphaerae bacterium]|nr:carbohydrate porin [Phycisphaerae bacterium]
MTRYGFYALVTVLLLATPSICHAQAEETASTATTSSETPSIWERDRLMDGWFDCRDQASDKGLDVNLTVINVYQQNFHGGLSTHRKAGRYSGYYNLELMVDFDKLKFIPGGSVYALAGGSWSEGIDGPSVGSLSNVNGGARGYRSIDLLELWYQQRLLDDRIRIRAGKIDLTGGPGDGSSHPMWFDTNAYANCEKTQFLNGALVINPLIPFPEQGLGTVLYISPVDEVYVLLGVADSQADRRTTGFASAFKHDTRVIAMAEVGVTPKFDSPNGPMPGGYRVGMWYDPQPKLTFAGDVKRNDVGLYANFDQMIFKENDDKNDKQGLGVFGRFGLADGDVSPTRQFYSAGLSYQGLIPTRDNDVIGIGIASGCLNRDFGFDRRRETALELFYNVQITPWLMLTPGLQHITHAGGENRDALVGGLRLQVVF